MGKTGLLNFVKTTRANFKSNGKSVRLVYVTDLIKELDNLNLEKYVSEKVPYFYSKLENIVERFKDEYFLTALKESLIKLPTSEHFQSSHFGEIVSSIFLEEVLGLNKIYSKLSMNTAENQNPHKMDILCYDTKKNPYEFVFCEVKSSPKDQSDGLPANHHKSCFADLFNSFNKYLEKDLNFDLTTIKENLEHLEVNEKMKLKKYLAPYNDEFVLRYMGMVAIDVTTYHTDEVEVLATRKNKKEFEVDVLCVEGYKHISLEVYKKYNKLKELL